MIRDRILDAAAECLAEHGLGKRLHAQIAERAGVSRPTVYKHLGDQEAVLEALLDREVTNFLIATESVLTARGPLRERFVDTIVFVVDYGQHHPVLQGALRYDPDVVLHWFITESRPLIERMVVFFTPHIKAAIADGDLPQLNPRILVEWSYRLVISLTMMPSTVPLDSPSALREFVEALLDFGLPQR